MNTAAPSPTPIIDALELARRSCVKETMSDPSEFLLAWSIKDAVQREIAPYLKHKAEKEEYNMVLGVPIKWIGNGATASYRSKYGDVVIVLRRPPR